jgi:hypothetical protein
MPTSIGSLIRPVRDAATNAVKDAKTLVKSVRHDIKRRQFDRRVSLKSVKAVKVEISKAPRKNMDRAETNLMIRVRACLNNLTTTGSADTSPEASADHEHDLSRDLDELIGYAQENAGKNHLLPGDMLKQALKDATADLRRDQLRLLRVRAVELYGHLGSQLKGEPGPQDRTIRDRQLALRLLLDVCNDRIIDKGYRSVFIGEHARTKEEKAIDSFVAAPLYSDTLFEPSKGLVRAINDGAALDEAQKLIEGLASGYKSFGDGLLFRALFHAFKKNPPAPSCEGLIDAIGRRAVALLETSDRNKDRDVYLNAWLMLKVHNAYYSAKTGQEAKEQDSGKRTVAGATIPAPEPADKDRAWAVQYRSSRSPIAQAKVAKTEEFEPLPGHVKTMIDRAFSAIRDREWRAAYRDLKALSALDWSSGMIAATADRALSDMHRDDRVVMNGAKLTYARKLMVAVANHAGEGKRQHAVQITATMNALDANYRKFASWRFDVADSSDEMEISDSDEMEISDADIEECLAVLDDDTAGTLRDFQIPPAVRMGAPFVEPGTVHPQRAKPLRFAEATTEAFAPLEPVDEVAVTRDRQRKIPQELHRREQPLVFRDISPRGRDLRGEVSPSDNASVRVPAEPAPRVPNAKRIDPNRPTPSWMRGGNRLANRDNEELTFEAPNASPGPEVSAEEVEVPSFGEEKDAFVYRRTKQDRDIERRAKWSSLTIDDLITSVAGTGGADRDRSTWTVDKDSIDQSTPTPSPQSVAWTRAETPRRNLEELSETLVASVLGKEFGQALRTLHELDRLDVSIGLIAKQVQENFRSSKANPTVANVGKFDAIVASLVFWSRGDLTTAIADKRSALQVQQTVDRIAALWNHLKRDPNISRVKQSKISQKERKAAIEVVKGLDAAESPPAHDLPKLLKQRSRLRTKPALHTSTRPTSG